MSEIWDLYDDDRKLIGKTHVRGIPLTEGEFHLVVDIWTMDYFGNILVTRRNLGKPFGGLWEGTGGSVVAGEGSLLGACRELLEETGINVEEKELQLIHSIKLSDRFVDTYLVVKNLSLGDLFLQEEEVMDAKLITIAEFKLMLKNKLIVQPIIDRWDFYSDIIIDKSKALSNE